MELNIDNGSSVSPISPVSAMEDMEGQAKNPYIPSRKRKGNNDFSLMLDTEIAEIANSLDSSKPSRSFKQTKGKIS